ncbi:MAG: hypothetical protein LC645_04005 [Geobacteraceae bacterium]|nr:hypothetical protein [Geobacteraceae bacterium]
MMILLSIPLGILCFIVAYHCYRADHAAKAVWCAALGVFFLVGAAVMGYGTVVMMQNIEPKNFDRSAPAAPYTATDNGTDTASNI